MTPFPHAAAAGHELPLGIAKRFDVPHSSSSIPRLSDHDFSLALARHYRWTNRRIDGWKVAENLSRIGLEIEDMALHDFARRIATKTVLRRAAGLVGPIRPAMQRRFEPLREPFEGEFDFEKTMENAVGRKRPEPSDWIMMHRRPKTPQVVLMMDVSLSMSGKNLALAALATAVLALKIRSGDLSVVVFDSTARTLNHFGHAVDREQLISEVLHQPARGFTNIEDALRVGSLELRAARSPSRAGILVTDGVYTAGNNPLRLASRFPRLFVLLTEDHKMDETLCRRLSAVGHGSLFRVREFDDLPSRMLDIANRILR